MAKKVLDFGYLESVGNGSMFQLMDRPKTKVKYNAQINRSNIGEKFALLCGYGKKGLCVETVYTMDEILNVQGVVDFIDNNDGKFAYAVTDFNNKRAIFFARNFKHHSGPCFDLRESLKVGNTLELEVVEQSGYPKAQFRAVKAELAAEQAAMEETDSDPEVNLANTDELESVKKDIHCIILSSKEQLNLSQLDQYYKEFNGHSINYETFGFSSLLSFLQNMTDVVQVIESNGGRILLKTVPNSKTDHVRNLVAGQKKNTRKLNQHSPETKSAIGGESDLAVIIYKQSKFAFGWSKMRGTIFIPYSEWQQKNRVDLFSVGQWCTYKAEAQRKTNNTEWIARKVQAADQLVQFDIHDRFNDLILKNIYGIITSINDKRVILWTEEVGRVTMFWWQVPPLVWHEFSVLDNITVDVHQRKRTDGWQVIKFRNVEYGAISGNTNWSFKRVQATLKRLFENESMEFTANDYERIYAKYDDYFVKINDKNTFKKTLESVKLFEVYVIPTTETNTWTAIHVRPLSMKDEENATERQQPASPHESQTDLPSVSKENSKCQTEVRLLEWHLLEAINDDETTFEYVKQYHRELLRSIRALMTGKHRTLSRLPWTPNVDTAFCDAVKRSNRCRNVETQTAMMMEKEVLETLSEDAVFCELMETRHDKLWNDFVLM